MTAQEIFDKVCNHLLTQGEKSRDDSLPAEEGRCRYRLEVGDKVLRCAAGCLIPDSLYVKEMEGRSWKNGFSAENRKPFVMEFPAIVSELGLDGHDRLIDALQSVHDNSEVCFWKDKLSYTAKIHNLEFKV